MLRVIRVVVIPGVVAISILGLPATFAAAAAASAASTYYVQAGGNDKLDGRTQQSAWKSINRVNQTFLHPGDQVLFYGGDAFAGLLYVPPGRGGTATSPITFSSYGTGKAIIISAAGAGFFAYDAAGIVISNLAFIGGGANANNKDGIAFFNDMAGGVKLAYVRISNVEVSGFGKAGISIGGWNGASGFTDAQITATSAHDNRLNGLISYGPAFNPGAPAYANTNFYVGHVSAYNNLGDPTLSGNSGNGIVLGSLQGGTIERSSAWGNGSLCTAKQCGAGIWTYDSTAITIQYNESYGNSSTSHVDGDGFDLDQNVSRSYVQYNYSHDNGGAGFLDYSGLLNSAHANNTLRYNISENDARTNLGAVTIGGHVYLDAVYNNTVFISGAGNAGAAAFRVIGAPSGVTVRNNILDAGGGVALISSPVAGTASVLFQQNDYAGAFRVVWGSSSYGGLAAWRTATGQEALAGAGTGLAADPYLASPGHGGTIGNPDLLPSLAAYRLLPASPMIAAALNLQTLFAIDMGGRDFYGIPVAGTPVPNVGAGD